LHVKVYSQEAGVWTMEVMCTQGRRQALHEEVTREAKLKRALKPTNVCSAGRVRMMGEATEATVSDLRRIFFVAGDSGVPSAVGS
jgi:hypothetical protein